MRRDDPGYPTAGCIGKDEIIRRLREIRAAISDLGYEITDCERWKAVDAHLYEAFLEIERALRVVENAIYESRLASRRDIPEDRREERWCGH